MHRAAPAEAEIQGSSRPRTRTSRGGPSAFHNSTINQRMDVAQSEEHRSPKPTVGGSTPSVHAQVEGPTGTGPATRPRGRRARHRANGHSAVGAPLRTQTPVMGSGANSTVDSIRQQAGPAPRERPAAAAATVGGDVGDASAAAHQEGDVGAARRPVASRIVVTAMRFDSSTFRSVTHLALSVQWSGRAPVEREITGSSPVRSAHDVPAPMV